jgi:hypothetical protein
MWYIILKQERKRTIHGQESKGHHSTQKGKKNIRKASKKANGPSPCVLETIYMCNVTGLVHAHVFCWSISELPTSPYQLKLLG